MSLLTVCTWTAFHRTGRCFGSRAFTTAFWKTGHNSLKGDAQTKLIPFSRIASLPSPVVLSKTNQEVKTFFCTCVREMRWLQELLEHSAHPPAAGGKLHIANPTCMRSWASSSLFKGVSTCFRWRFRQHLARGTLPWCWLEGNPNQKRSSRIDSSLYAKCVVTHYFFSMQQSVLCRAWRIQLNPACTRVRVRYL